MTGTSQDRLFSFITFYGISQAISCAASLGIADHLHEQPRSAVELASLTGTSAPHLERLMWALCSIGVFGQSADGFHQTTLSQSLRKNAEHSLWPLAVFHGRELYGAFSKLMENIQTGKPAWEIANGQPIWEYLAQHPDRSALFDSSMRVTHESELDALVDACDFSNARIIADIGGGEGALLRRVLEKYPSARGILQDAPGVVAHARESEAWAPLVDRCEFVGRSFFEQVAGGADVYLAKRILHDWEDAPCVEILKRCRAAMSATSRLVLIESVRGIAEARWLGWADLGVMIFGGKERTLEEFEQRLAQAGLALRKTSSPLSRLTLLEAGIA